MQTVGETAPAILTQDVFGVCPSKVLQNWARNQSGKQLRGDHGGEQVWRCRQIESAAQSRAQRLRSCWKICMLFGKLDRFLA
jgi:hypothetical protein